MISINTSITFFGIAVLLALAPGPDNLFVLMQSALWGRKAGLLVVLGLVTGVLGHTLAVTIGLASLFAASPFAFTALRLAGAAYLVYLAWQILRAPVGPGPTTHIPAQSSGALYRRGIIMSLTNPKVLLFFFSFLPQFTSPARGPVAPQMLQLGFLFMLAALLVFSALALFSASLGARLQRSRSMHLWLNRIAALVFIGLALRLATLMR